MKKYTRKYALIFILIAFAVSISIWPLAARQSISTTQEDPGTAETGFSVSLSNTLDYGPIAEALANGGYASVEELIGEIDREDLPADIQFILQTYDDLLTDITGNLNKLEDGDEDGDDGMDDDEILYKIESYLEDNDFVNASSEIDRAKFLVEDTWPLLADFDSANEQIQSIMGSFTPAEQLEVAKKLRTRLEDDKVRLDDLIDAYDLSAPQTISTTLGLELDDYAYRGLPYKISGQISYDDGSPPVERDISLFWDYRSIDTVYTYRDQGTFEIEITPDGNTLLGGHVLEVRVEARDGYSSTSDIRPVTVKQTAPDITIDDLSYQMMSRKVHISGKLDFGDELNSKTSLAEAAVFIELKGVSTRVPTSVEGEFEALLSLPFGLVNLGKQQVKIRFEPSETWQSPIVTTAETFVMDIFSIGFISATFIAVGMIVYVAKRGRPVKGGGWVIEEPPTPDLAEEFNNTSIWEFREEDLPGTRGQILKSYTEAMKRVEGVAGIHIKPHMTLREFLRESSPKLNGAAESFSELTSLAENALYSPNAPGLEDTTRAESLAQTTREVLKP